MPRMGDLAALEEYPFIEGMPEDDPDTHVPRITVRPDRGFLDLIPEPEVTQAAEFRIPRSPLNHLLPPSPAMRALQERGTMLGQPLQATEEAASGALQGVRDILRRDLSTPAVGAGGVMGGLAAVPDEAEAGYGGYRGPPIRTFHSSPHDFERFDVNRLGSGEGNQAYTAGHYFAQSPAVSGRGGRYWHQFMPRFAGTDEGAAAHALRMANFDREKAIAATEGNVRKLLESGKPVGPRTYEVDLQASPRDFLPWEATIGELPGEQRRALGNAGRDYSHETVGNVLGRAHRYPDYAGEVVGRASAGPLELTSRLEQRGIPGVSYLDARSRPGAGADLGSPTRNYVVYNDQIPTIRKKYLVPGAVMGGVLGLPDEGVQAKEALPPGTLAAQSDYRAPSADPLLPMPRLPGRASEAAEAGPVAGLPGVTLGLPEMVKSLGEAARGRLTEDEARTLAVTAGIGAMSPMKGRGPAFKQPGAEGAAQALFDYSRIKDVPDVKQFDLPRYSPKHGVSERVENLIKNKRVERSMLDYFERGKGLNAETFYYNEPLREAFISELGKTKGQEKFARYMDYVAGTSPRSTVPENARNASYYYWLEQQGLPVPSKGGVNQQPYGHLAQNLHRLNAEKIRSGEYFDPVKNPKPLSFSQNLQGNFLPATIDAHAFKAPPMIKKDPEFLLTSLKEEKGKPSVYPQRMYESGELTMKEALKRPAFWAGKPNPNEYAAMEQYYKRLAHEAGLAPAQGQAAGWAGAGELTGLGSVAGDPFMRAVENRAIITAAERGITPAEALSRMMRGKEPLLGIAGAAGMGGLAAQDRYEQ